MESFENAVGVLQAFREVVTVSWPDLSPDLDARARLWPTMSDRQLAEELSANLARFAEPPREIRVFWKDGVALAYKGANPPFARDAGFETPAEMIGATDFDAQVPWTRQAAKYQADDREVMAAGTPKLDILERQARADGVFWLHTGKAPVRDTTGAVVGVLGVYETVDADQAKAIRRRTGAL